VYFVIGFYFVDKSGHEYVTSVEFGRISQLQKQYSSEEGVILTAQTLYLLS